MLLLISTGVFIFWSSKKEVWFCDEIYTYESANGIEGYWPHTDTGVWMSGEDIERYLAADSNSLSYKAIADNLYGDHVPLYFWIFRTVSLIFFKGSASQWIGLSINLFFFIAFISIAYFSLCKSIGNIQAGLATLIAFVISKVGIEQYTFLRMYMMLLFLALAVILIGFKLIYDTTTKKKLSPITFIGLFFVTLIGLLTHYDFWIFYAVAASTICIYLLISSIIYTCKSSENNKLKNIIKSKQFIGVLIWIASFAVALISMDRLFPYWKWNLHKDKGDQALSSLTVFSEEKIQNILWGYSTIPNYIMGAIPVILGIIIILAVIVIALIILKNKKRSFEFICLLLTVIISNVYLIAVCFTLPAAKEFRYLWCIISLLQLCFVWSIAIIVNHLDTNKTIIYIIGIIACLVLSTINIILANGGKNIAYLYYEDKDTNALNQYADIPWVVYGPIGGVYSYYDWIIPNKICFIDDINREEAKDILKELESKDYILYSMEEYKEEAVDYINSITDNNQSASYLTKSVSLKVYLVE